MCARASTTNEKGTYGYSYFIHFCHISYRWIGNFTPPVKLLNPPHGKDWRFSHEFQFMTTTIVLCTAPWPKIDVTPSHSFDFACYGEISTQFCWFWLPYHICYIIVTWVSHCKTLTGRRRIWEFHSALALNVSPRSDPHSNNTDQCSGFQCLCISSSCYCRSSSPQGDAFGTWTKIFFGVLSVLLQQPDTKQDFFAFSALFS